jgi:hypothetical protein
MASLFGSEKKARVDGKDCVVSTSERDAGAGRAGINTIST